MIIYKRRLRMEDIVNLNKEEELIYYKTEKVAITIVCLEDSFLVRKKEISTNKKINEVILKTIDEIMEVI